MKVELAAGIESVSGKCGNMIFKTFKRPNGKTETRAYFNPYHRTRWEKVSARKSKPTKSELKARSSFGAIASEVARRLREGDTRPRSIIWKEVASTFAAE